jgi:hypothetical protein
MPRSEEEKKEHRRAYMREYKRKQYADDKKTIQDNNKKYYLAKCNSEVTLDEINTFPVMQLEFTKALICLRFIQKEHPDILKTYLQTYIDDL